MIKKRMFAVRVLDMTCTMLGHKSGIYGRGDYSWITDNLNGNKGGYHMTDTEAQEVKADFERVIKERNLTWATVDVVSVEMLVAETMQDIADFYNNSDCLNVAEMVRMIKANGWVNDCGTDWGICHDDTEKVVVNDDGKAVVENFVPRGIPKHLIRQRRVNTKSKNI